MLAIREAPQESLGFSPFEMVFGRQLGGLLSLVMDEWLNSLGRMKTVAVKKYIYKLKESLSKVREIARENVNKA